MRNLIRVATAYVLLFSCAVVPASAEVGFEESFFFMGAPAVSIASKGEESLLAASGTVYVITDKDISNYGWKSLMEVLNAIPNMDLKYDFHWLQGGQRGFTGSFNGSILLIDGREVQNLLASEAYFTNYYPAHYIKRVEVLQGPNSTLYDANATQGVINVITKFGDQGKETLNEASVTYGEAGLRSYNAVFKKVVGDKELGFSAHHSTVDNDFDKLAKFYAGGDYSKNTGFVNSPHTTTDGFRMRERDWSFDAYFRYKGFYGGVDYFFYDSEGGYESAPSVPISLAFNPRRGMNLTYTGYKHKFSDKLSAFAEFQYINEFDEWMFGRPNATGGGQHVASQTTDNTVRPKWITQMTWTPNEKHEVIGGFEYLKVKIGHLLNQDNAIRPVFANENINAEWTTDKEGSTKRSYFIQDSFKIVPDRFKLTGGVRFVSQDFTNDQTLPRASAVWTPTDTSAFKATYSKAFRPPNMFEFKGTQSASIDSQEMEMTELNYSQNFTMGEVKMSNIAAVYHMVSTGKIDKIQKPGGGAGLDAFITVTGGSEKIDGFEDQLSFQAGKMSGFISGRYIKPEEKKVGLEEVVLDVPSYKAKVGLSYAMMKYVTLSAFVDHWGKVKADRLTADNANGVEVYEIDPWTRADINLRFGEFDLGDGMRANISLYCENVGDKQVLHANNRGADPHQYMQNPRNFRVNGELRF